MAARFGNRRTGACAPALSRHSAAMNMPSAATGWRLAAAPPAPRRFADWQLAMKTILRLLGHLLRHPCRPRLPRQRSRHHPAQQAAREEFRFQAREGFVVVQKGDQVRIERNAADPVVTMPKLRTSSSATSSGSRPTRRWCGCSSSPPGRGLPRRGQPAPGARPAARAAAAESAAQLAQVRALRYQVNPHFLFNTLNSLSSWS
jgi:hypothetical protein